MVRLSFFVVLVSFLCFACGKQTEIAEVRDGEGNLIEKYAKDPKTNLRNGLSTKYIGKRKVEEAHYLNDVLHGERKVFYENGTVEALENYENGIFVGPYKSFYEKNNSLKSEGEYVAGKMTGNWKFYYPNGRIKEIVAFKENEEDGPFEEYYESGTIKAKGNYKTLEGSVNPNKEHGLLELFDETGTLVKKMNCNYGACVTTWTQKDGAVNKEE